MQNNFLNTGPASKKNTKRASSISILSGLGVSDPEKALDPPSPTSGALNPAVHDAKRPSKLHNFFGHRPPSELITNHLPDYFPSVEKKVLERTARHSLMLRTNLGSSKQDSTISRDRPLPSRFSNSTQGSLRRSSISPTRSSHSSVPPPPPTEKNANSSGSEKDGPGEDIPRMSLSTDDGRSVELHPDDVASPSTMSTSPQLLPPIPTTNESFSESFGSITGRRTSRSPSRMVSTASKRMSYMTELRSKRDRSDTASLMTVDEITAEVESRRASTSVDQGSDTDDWTQISEDEPEDETMEETLNEEADSEVDDTEEATCVNADDGDDDEPRVTSKGGKCQPYHSTALAT
jgi:mitogen-activated protein kinase kinase kinase